MTHEKRADLILSHYQDTSTAVLGHLNARNRLFLYVMALIALLAVEMCSPGSLSAVINGYIENHVLEDPKVWTPLDFSAIDLVVRFLFLCLVIHYYQRSIQVNRMYTYLGSMENDLRDCMADDANQDKYYISLAGRAYVSKTGAPSPDQKKGKDHRPWFLRSVGLLYEWVFPFAIIGLACQMIFQNVLALQSFGINVHNLNLWAVPLKPLTIHGLSVVFSLAIIVYSLLYMKCAKGPR